MGYIPTRAKAITTSDSADNYFDSIYVGGDGNVAVITAGGDTITFQGVLGGTILPVKVKKVLATGTTATNLVGLL